MTFPRSVRLGETLSINSKDEAPFGSDDLDRLIKSRRNAGTSSAEVWTATLHSHAQAPDVLLVGLQDGQWVRVGVAASCLVLPCHGDLVQVMLSHGRCWVLHVLERANPQAPLVLHVGESAVHLRASALHLKADTALHLQARELRTDAQSVEEFAARKHSSIEGWSTAQASFMDLKAERQLNLFGSTTTLVADALIKVDGAQIHVG